ncbi:hypothetical protein ACFSWE_12620 [Leucobacter albus]|uniref:Uncharacterized protein n=1 Tax=Leucobacter albus TaxID=272210 RepID=A0ABW3TUL5_9MICO
MKSVFVTVMGLVLAVWMSAGRWFFGIGGSLTWWYVPAIGLTYAVLLLWVGHRMAVTEQRGRRTGRAVWVALILSWVCAVGFGFTVPDNVGGELDSIISHASGSQFSAEMSIALCNPLGILAFSLAFVALGFAIANGREPRPEEDELLDAAEAAAELRMVEHPLMHPVRPATPAEPAPPTTP